jgi:alpha-1,6-mannosyltransferase
MSPSKNGNSFWVASFLFVCVLVIQSYFIERTNFLALISCIAVAFSTYLLLLKEVKHSNLHFDKLLLFLFLIPIFSLPNLSNDFYRFLWDGELINSGINPFDFKPNELIWKTNFRGNAYWEDLYAGMGELSQENYSCYPVFNQFYFAASTFFSDSILVNTIILRILILVSLFSGFHYLKKLLLLFKFDSSRFWIFALNPLLIIEVSQNLHFEGVMLSFFIIGLYFLAKNKILQGSLFLALAIQIKLIPLILLPFLLRWLNWKRSLLTWTLTILFTILLSVIFIYPSNYLNFLQSITLYFHQFEFNSFILHYYIEYGKWRYGYNRILTFGPYLSRLSTDLILLFAWFGPSFTFEKMMKRMFFAILIYYFLSSTVHPWYLLTPLLLGIFTNYITVVLWSALVFLSYYSYSEFDQSYFRTIIFVEYILVFGSLAYEIFKSKSKISRKYF